MSSRSHLRDSEHDSQRTSYIGGGVYPAYVSPANSQHHSQQPYLDDGIDRPEGSLDAGAFSEGDFLGSRFINLDTESQAEAKYHKGDRFDARIKVDAADQSWNRVYEYTRTAVENSLFVSSDTRRTSPSTYLDGSASSSAHTADQGQAGPSRPPRIATYQRGPSEQIGVVEYPQEEAFGVGGGGHEERHGSANSEVRGSRRSHQHGNSHRRSGHHHHSRQRSRRNSRAVKDDFGCCVLM